VHLSTAAFHGTQTSAVVVALLFARTAGKVVGIAGMVFFLRSAGVLRFEKGITMGNMIGASLLCGVGFTVPLLYASVAFAHEESLFAATQLGLLLASGLGLLGGVATLLIADRHSKATST
jgi:NhaA family Na+:H+ antiporter